MNPLPHVLYLTLLLDTVLGSLPAPVNLSVSSVNFHHVLRWDPGRGTPAGTTYIIKWRVYGKSKRTHSFNSTTTSFTVKFPPKHVVFRLSVQASYNNTQSKESSIPFDPYTQTIIGPPKVSLSGCGKCIHVNISLPEADPRSGFKDIMSIYHDVKFRVFWKKRNETAECFLTKSRNSTVTNLQIGTEYCVWVSTEININRNTMPSAVECTFTGKEEPGRGPVFSGAVAALVIVSGILVISLLFLYHTGFLCKVTTLPRALIKSLSQGCTLTPERTYPDKVYVGAEMEKQRNNNNPSGPHAASRGTNSDEEEEEDEEEEGGNVYMDRDAELSSGEGSCRDSADVWRNSRGAVSGGSGSFKVQDTEFEVEVRHWDLDQSQGKAGGTDVSFLPDGPVTVKLKEDEDEEEEEEDDHLGDINLFSVTLAALAACEEGEEEQTPRDHLSDPLLDPEPVLNSKRTLSHTDSQRETTSINAGYTRRLH
ncbi:interferon alpha/beta receptor 2 isoform X2 [Gasterosteus aculeatus]